MAESNEYLYGDALPYYDKSFDELGVREFVQFFSFFIFTLNCYFNMHILSWYAKLNFYRLIS